MESATEVQRAWNSYAPCHFMEQVLKALSKCFGFGNDKDGEVTPTTSRAMRRPPRPPLSAGRGGQINISSS
ncbi:hypothetical protein RJT34_00878 [Clitoria ternatea]|uniref:Uncharacterized protein n=1 Tax=Clitoria ternatea TaxID=43366 RepID=A0AAN9KIG7_CLITE